MKLTKKILAIILALMTIISVETMASISVQAAIDEDTTTLAEKEKEPEDGYILPLPDIEEVEVDGSSSDKQRSNSISYNYLGKVRYFGSIRYYDYLCYKNSSNWYMETGKNLTDAVYHKQSSGKKNLSFTKSQTYHKQTASNFSTSAGGEAGVADMVKANVSFGAGITKTVGKSYQTSSTIQAEIPASSKTGYYKMEICYNYYKTKVIQQRTDGTNKVTQYIYMPFGESYAAVMYSSSAASGSWSRW